MPKKLFLLFVICVSSTVFGTDNVFTGGGDGSSWSDTSNWSRGTLPISSTSEDSYIGRNAASNLTVNITGTAVSGQMVLGGSSDTGTHTLNVQSGATYNTVSYKKFGIGSHGVLNVNGGSVNAWGANFVGATVNINSGSLGWASNWWDIKTGAVIKVHENATLYMGDSSSFSGYNGTGYNPNFTGVVDICGGKMRTAGDDTSAILWHISNGNIIAYNGDSSYDLQVTYESGYTWVEAVEIVSGNNYFTGDGDGTSWSDPDNWSLDVVPVYNTTDLMLTYIGFYDENANYSVTIDGEAGSGRTWIGIPETAGGTYILNIEEGGDYSLVRLYVGYRGTLNVNGGVVSVPECIFQSSGSIGNVTGGELNISSNAWRIEDGATVNLTSGPIRINNNSSFSAYPATDSGTGVIYNSRFSGILNLAGGELIMNGNWVAPLNWHIDNGNLVAYDGDGAYHLETTYDGSQTHVIAVYGTNAYDESPSDNATSVAVDTSLGWKVPPVVLSGTLYMGQKYKSDLNDDFSVDIDDLSVLANYFLSDSVEALDTADINHDLAIDLCDFAAIAGEWNNETVMTEIETFLNESGSMAEYVYTPTTALAGDTEYVWRVDTTTTEGSSTGQQWQFKTISTAKKDIYWLYEEHPDIVEGIFDNFDLTLPELAEVNQAVSEGNWKLACRKLLNYYRVCSSGSWLRGTEISEATEDTIIAADLILQDRYTHQNVLGQVPRTAAGTLNWKYLGPENDYEWAWMHNRFQYLPGILERAYRSTGNTIYLERINEEIQDWILNCPYSATTSNPEWRGLEVAIRAGVFMELFYRLYDDPNFDDVTKLLILSTLRNHAQFLLDNHQSGGNWLLTEMRGVATVGGGWPELEQSEAYLDYAFTKVLPQINSQVLPDGVHAELTTSYHYVALKEFNYIAELAKNSGQPVDEDYDDCLELMWNYLAMAVRPNGYSPLNSDTDLHDYRSLFVAAADVFERPDWIYTATNGAEGTLPTGEPSVFFPWAGQLISRSGWDYDAHWSFFDLGPAGIGGGHLHLDRMHFSADAYGRDILVDAGRFAYYGDIAATYRGYAVGTASHNVARLAGMNQKVGLTKNSSPQTNDCQITPTYDFAKASLTNGYDGIEGTANQQRLMRYERGKYWVIVDRFITDRARSIETLWHFHPECTVGSSGLETLTTDAGLGNMRIVPVGSVGWTLDIISGQLSPSVQGWYSVEYGLYEANSTAMYSADITGDTIFAWLIIPGQDTPAQMSAQIISSTSSSVTITVTEAPGLENTFQLDF